MSCSEQLDRVSPSWRSTLQDMSVGVHLDGDLSVPEHLHDGPRGNALGKQERRAPVPQIMQPQPVQASPLPQLIPALVQVARLDWRADQKQGRCAAPLTRPPPAPCWGRPPATGAPPQREAPSDQSPAPARLTGEA